MGRSAWAKVNLFLRVLAREASGYHRIETLFCGLELGDRMRVAEGPPGEGVTLRVRGPWALGPEDENLAVRAARAFGEGVGDPGLALRIDLEKRVPPGAGLGGGSADAAAVLRAANRLGGRPLSPEELLEVGASLGSDVPFFLGRTPLALAWGRGERILSLPALEPRPVVVLVPPFGVSTGEAYAELSARIEAGPSRARPRILDRRSLESWAGVEALAENDFEGIVFGRHPELRTARSDLLALGATAARLTGTGSALFGLFPPGEGVEQARVDALVAERSGWRAIRTRTLGRWPVERAGEGEGRVRREGGAA